MQAFGCFDAATNQKGGPPPEHEQWSIHAVQSFLWKIAGALFGSQISVRFLTSVYAGNHSFDRCYEIGPNLLSEPQENIILSFTEPGTLSEARWDAHRSRAERVCPFDICK